jgi:hypothetical protein
MITIMTMRTVIRMIIITMIMITIMITTTIIRIITTSTRGDFPLPLVGGIITLTQQKQVPTTPTRDRPHSTEINATPAMIAAGADVLIGFFGPDHYGNERKYHEAASAAYRAMVSKRSQK